MKHLLVLLALLISTSANAQFYNPPSNVTILNFPPTQPVSLSVNTPDVTDRSARLLGHVTVDNASLAVTGALTDTQLRASAVPISIAAMPSTPVTGTFWQSTQPVSLASIPNSSNFDVLLSTRLKPSDTLTKVTTVDTITNSVAVTGTFWQSTQPVSIASMPSTPVTGTFFQSTQPISAVALPLPLNAAQETGGNLATIAVKDFATSAKQDSGNISLTSIDAKIPSKGNNLTDYSQPVTIAANQRPIQVQMTNTLTGNRTTLTGRISR